MGAAPVSNPLLQHCQCHFNFAHLLDMSLNPDVLAALNESSTLSLINELVVLRKVTQSTPDFQKVADDVYYCRIGFKHSHLEKV
jgi:hypothetical protein